MTRPELASALHVALTEPEPDGPACYLCGSTTGPWLPDPSGVRWPSGAQMLLCSRGCPEPAEDTTVEHAAAKDSRQAASTLSSDVLDLLAAIRDTVNLPLPSTADVDDRAWQQLMHRRLIDLHAVLSVSLHPDYVTHLAPADLAADLRARTAAAPVTYTLWQTAALNGGEQA